MLGDRRWLAAAAAALVVLAVVGARFVGSITPVGVATFQVGPGRFVREVEARGSLKAVKATPILVPPESGRQQKVAFLAKDGAFLKAGETVVEFDPYDAEREAADGNADLTAAQAKIEKARAEGTKNVAALGLDKDVAKEQLDGAETFRLTDESLYSRHQIIESQLDRDLFKAKADVAERKLAASGRMSSAERALGEIDAGKARLKVQIAEKGLRSLRIQAPHDGLLVLERNWRGEVPSVGDTLWPGQKVAEMPDLTKLEAKVFVLEADARRSQGGPEGALRDRGPSGRGVRGRGEPRRAARQDARLAVAGEVLRGDAVAGEGPRQPQAGPEASGRSCGSTRRTVCSRSRAARSSRRTASASSTAQSGSGFEPVEVTTSRAEHLAPRRRTGLAAGDLIALRDPNAKRSQVSTGSGRAGRAGHMIDLRESLSSANREPAPPRAALVPRDARDHLRRGRRDRDALDRRRRRAPGARDHRRDGPPERRGEGQALRPRERAHRDPQEVARGSRAAMPSAIREAVPGVERVVAKIEVEAWKVQSPAGRAKPRVLGVSSDYPALVNVPLVEGRFFDREDEERHALVCVIGDQVRRELFGFEPALGRPLKVNDQWLTVVGVLASGGGKREIQGVTLEGTANDIYLPVTAAERKLRQGTAQGAARRAGGEPRPGNSGAGVGGGGEDAHRPAPRRRRRLHDHGAGGAARAEPEDAATVRRRDGRDRRHLAARGRDRNHEHHAGDRARAHARDRRAPRDGRAPGRHPQPVLPRGLRGHGRPAGCSGS